ncbi:MAG: response regulator [Myxococcales bacterium]|nr:response regulator [Myxococcales bacterium]
MKILVVEDNDLNRRLVQAVLKPKGHVLEEVQNAADAIAALNKAPPPDLVLLDINIPGGGLSVAAHVQSTPALQAITVIATTAFAMRGDEERFLAAGCHGYISKPIDVKTFAAQIEAIIRGRK